MKWREMPDELLELHLRHFFFPPLDHAEGYITLVLRDLDDSQHREDLQEALDAVQRIRGVVHNMIEGEMEWREMPGKLLNAELKFHFLSPLVIGKGYVSLVLKDVDNPDHREQLRQALQALHRVENVVHNMVEEGEIRE